MAAVSDKHVSTIKLLLARDDLDVNLGAPLYILANSDDNIPIMKLLLAHNKTDVNQLANPRTSKTAFYRAIARKAWKAADLLLERADLDVNEGSPLKLLYTGKQGTEKFDMLRRLLARNGTDVNQGGPSGRPALYWALRLPNWDAVRLLAAHPDVDVDAGDDQRWNALHGLVADNRRGRCDEAIKWVLQVSSTVSPVMPESVFLWAYWDFFGPWGKVTKSQKS